MAIEKRGNPRAKNSNTLKIQQGLFKGACCNDRAGFAHDLEITHSMAAGNLTISGNFDLGTPAIAAAEVAKEVVYMCQNNTSVVVDAATNDFDVNTLLEEGKLDSTQELTIGYKVVKVDGTVDYIEYCIPAGWNKEHEDVAYVYAKVDVPD